MYFLLIGLFVALTPGILVTLPKKGSKVAVAATHALLFAVIVYLLRKYQYEGFQNTPSMPISPSSIPIGSLPPGSMPPGSIPPPSMPPGSMPPGSTPQAPGAVPESITLTKQDMKEIKDKLLPIITSSPGIQKVSTLLYPMFIT